MSNATAKLHGRFVTVPGAARMLGVSPPTILDLIDEGKLEAHRPRVQLRISIDSVRRHLDSTREGPAATSEPVFEDAIRD